MSTRFCAALLAAALFAVSAFASGTAGPPPEEAQKYPPGIMYSTILANVKVNARGGWFHLGNQIQNVFVPSGSSGKAVLSRGNGTEICHWMWELDEYALPPPYKLFAFRQPLEPSGRNYDPQKLKLTEPGAYVLDFYIGSKVMYSFPFSVSTLEPENPFDGETMYFIDGAWSDWGYLFYKDAEPGNTLYWKIWLRERSFRLPNRKVSVEITRDSDRKVVCLTNTGLTFNFSQEWVRYEFQLVGPGDAYGSYFKARDLLAVDGAYTLRMAIDGKEYGRWKFSVAAGRLVTTGRADRAKADSLSFVEGGKDAFWYEKAK